jgi:hypothetical protein
MSRKLLLCLLLFYLSLFALGQDTVPHSGSASQPSSSTVQVVYVVVAVRLFRRERVGFRTKSTGCGRRDVASA